MKNLISKFLLVLGTCALSFELGRQSMREYQDLWVLGITIFVNIICVLFISTQLPERPNENS